MSLQDVYSYIHENSDRFVEELQALIRQPSVSAHNLGTEECAVLLQRMMIESGIDTELVEIPDGPPIVFGEVKSRKSKRTLLIYGHYDVQPPEPLEEWIAPPFGAEIVDGKIIGRGATDDKGSLLAHVKGAEAFLRTRGGVPVNLKYLFEGEEEISSIHLPEFVEQNKDFLRADAGTWFDAGLDDSGRPRVHLGSKGMLYVELRSKVASKDLHSMLAPLVPNPAWKLIWALNTIKDKTGRICVDGWYDSVLPLTAAERELVKDIPFDSKSRPYSFIKAWKQQFGLESPLNELNDVESLLKLLEEPTCNVCGFNAGYAGPGAKTVLPHEARAKVDFRLVVNQDPDSLFQMLNTHLQRHGFSDLELVKLGALEPAKSPHTCAIAQSIYRAARQVFRKKPVFWPAGYGSGPAYLFVKRLGLPLGWAGSGFGPRKNLDANLHAPNENMPVKGYIQGIEFSATIMHDFGLQTA